MRFGQNKKEEAKVVSVTTTPIEAKGILTDIREEPVDLNSTAFSVTNHPEGGFALVEVKFNPVTMQAKVESVKKVSDSREEAEYYFRVKVGEYFADMERKS